MPKLVSVVGRAAANQTADVRVVQQLLNRHRPLPLALIKVDGKIGPRTINAIEHFQRHALNMHAPDGVISPTGATFRALAGGQPSVERVAWGSKVSAAFKMKVIEIAQALELNPDFLMAAMAFESGETFSASIENAAGSGAVGLIQFMPSTARALGTTTEALSKMTAEAQLEYVKQYFLPRRGRLHSIEDVYMAILYPAAIGQPIDAALFKSGTKVYRQNAGLDANRDGTITVGEAAMAVRRKYDRGVRAGYLG